MAQSKTDILYIKAGNRSTEIFMGGKDIFLMFTLWICLRNSEDRWALRRFVGGGANNM